MFSLLISANIYISLPFEVLDAIFKECIGKVFTTQMSIARSG
jgi:hypothetical protein